MNIFINTIYMDDFTRGRVEKRFPLIYFWLKDYYYQRSPDNFPLIDWYYDDNDTLLRDNKELQQQLFDNPPDVVGLSLYMWNVEKLLDNSQWIKENFPDCLIVAAGPNADSRPEFMSENTQIDYVILGPGAEAFRRILDAKIAGEDVNDVLGVNYWNGNHVVSNPPVPRKEEPLVLDYVNNFRDEVVEMLDYYTSKYESVIFLTMMLQGCPYSCSFCEQGTSFWTKIQRRPVEKIYDEIDLIKNYDNVVYEWADANFGIVPDYEKAIDYCIEHGNGNIKFKKPPFAKNNVEHTFHLIKKMKDSGIYSSPHNGVITLQDPNPDIVKMNGRPFSKEYEKIAAYREYTKDQEYKMTQVEIILGMPGQSWTSLRDSLHTLMEQDLLSHYLPYLYLVFPNTAITAPDSTVKIESKRMHVRNERVWTRGWLDFHDAPSEISYEHIIKTETLETDELVGVYYYWNLMCHIYGYAGWLRTPLRYLDNYHDVSMYEFVEVFVEHFNPKNWHKLPDSIRLDLEATLRWFKQDDKLFQRRDITDQYWLSPRQLPHYRIHSNYDDFEKIFKDVFQKLMPDDPYLDDLMQWQKARLLHIYGDVDHTITSYNWDDISRAETDTYYKSQFTFVFQEQDYEQTMLDIGEVHFLPTVDWKEVNPEVQTPLSIKY